MASILRRPGTTGTVRWRVRWREGGLRDGRPDGETCDTPATEGHQRPEGYPKGCRGLKLQRETTSEPQGRPFTLEDGFNEYLAKRVDADRRTIHEYRRDFDNHVKAAIVKLPDGQRVGPLGQVPMREFTEDIDQAWVNHMRSKTYGAQAKHYSAKTIINIHGSVISPVFEYGVRRQRCAINPCRDVDLPERRGRSVKAHQVLDSDEFPDWIDCAYEVDEDTGDITATILATGIRWGELTALPVRDVKIRRRPETGDITGARITITQVVKEDEHRRPYISTEEGKSPNAFRTIEVGEPAAKILAARMEGRAPNDLIFPPPGTRGGRIWRNPNFHAHRWVKVKAIAARRGLTKDPSPHRMRHAHATALIPLHGIESVSKRLGHANVLITSEIYSHLVASADQQMATALDGVLRRRSGPDEAASRTGTSVAAGNK
ncbi:MAG: tyrosine-type recombinase/integrase [Mycobacteriales bacterium]